MVTCKYCRFLSPGGAKFCGQCGRSFDEMGDRPTTNAIITDHKEMLPGDALTELSFSNPDNPTAYVPGSYLLADNNLPTRQGPPTLPPERVVYAEEHRTAYATENVASWLPAAVSVAQPELPTHQQPPALHAQHQQAGVVHAAHQQPRMPHAAHRQPHALPAQYQRPFVMRAQPQRHQQPSAIVKGKPARPARRWLRYHPSYLIGAISTFIIAAIITTSLLVYMVTHGAAAPALVLVGVVEPGQTMTVSGNHFTPGSAVSITVDNQPFMLSGSAFLLSGAHVHALNASPAQSLQTGNTVNVDAQGGFTATGQADLNWHKGSTHTLRAYAQGGNFIAQYAFPISSDVLPATVTPAETVTATPTAMATVAATATPISAPTAKVVLLTPTPKPPTPLPTPLPTPTVVITPAPPCLSVDKATLQFAASVGGTNPAALSVTVSEAAACGAGPLTVTQTQPWLTATAASKQVVAGGKVAVSVSARVTGLSVAQTYTDTITLASGTVTLKIPVQFVVAPAPCIDGLLTRSLDFMGTSGVHGKDPVTQTYAVVDGKGCTSVRAGLLSATVVSGSNWLQVSSGSQVSSGVAANFTVTALSVGANLTPGAYKGSLVFTLKTDDGGSATLTVNVTLTVTVGLQPIH